MLKQRQRDVLELTRLLPVSWCSACVYGEDADDRHRRRQDSELEDASADHVDITDEDGMVNSSLRFKVLMNHNDRSVAAMAGPKDVTENAVRVVWDRLETWRFGVCSLKCQNRTPDQIAERSWQDETSRDNSVNHNEVFAQQFGSLGI